MKAHSRSILFVLPEQETLGKKISYLPWECGRIEVRRFPDGEAYVRILDAVAGASVYLYCSLLHPDEKILPLLWIAATARELGAESVRLIAPYLAYLRQDKRFREGEGITSRYFAHLISQSFDGLLTVDPHLHRYRSLDEIYSIPTQVLSATKAIANWIGENVENPLLIGPDQESEQWASQVAEKVGAPYVVAVKQRRGDRQVEIQLPEIDRAGEVTPVLLDDIISTGHTMVETIKLLRNACPCAPVCIGVHAIFAGNAYADLLKAGAGRIATCNTLEHSSNCIDLSEELASAVLRLE